MMRQYSKQEVRLTLTAIMVVFLLSAMDQTVVSTAMPRIIEQLHGLERFTWVTTAYMLASTVMVPIYGKLGDLFGRKPILIWGIAVFLFASALCGVSGEAATLPIIGDGMNQLIVFRALQGIGGAALFTTAFATIGDLLPPAERARYGGLFGAVFGIASVLGPLVGGFLTDHGTVDLLGGTVEGWRWVFYVNLPLGLLALFVVIAKMPRFGGHDPGSIDFAGAALIALTCVPLLLALTWGGHTYAWDSLTTIALFGGSVVALVLLLLVEARVRHPIIPLELFANKTFARANLAGFLLGVAFFGTIMFLPLYLQIVQGVPATNSGLTLLPLMVGMIGSSILAGRYAAKIGRYKPLMIGGSIVLLGAIGWLCTLGLDTPRWAVSLRMVVVGMGLGPAQSLYSLTIQNAVPMNRMGVATSSAQFFRQIGSTIGIAVFGALMTNHLAAELPQRAPAFAQMAAQMANPGSHATELSSAQTVAMNPERIEAELEKRLAPAGVALRQALSGNRATADALLASHALPAEVEADLRAAGGAPPETAEALEGHVTRLMETLRANAHALAERTIQALKESFLVSIIDMFKDSAIIILLGALVTLTIPELPLRKWPAKAAPPEAVPVQAE
jgi:EmrB/QacA subfamily drug resistance transporter